MKLQLTGKAWNYARRGSLGLLLWLGPGALGVLGAAGCGGGSTSTDPSVAETPGTGPGTIQPALPYDPPYPPLAPQVQRGAGQLLTAPQVIPVFFSGDKMQSSLYGFISSYVTGSAAWQVLQEYGVGAGTVAPATVLTQTLSANLTDKDVQNFLGARVQDGSIKPGAQSVVVLFLPATVVVSNGGEVSCESFAGYHGSALLGSGALLAYAVIPRCAAETLGALTFAVSHELAEASTDPYLMANNDLADPYALWSLNLSGAEVGDLCQNLVDAAAGEAGVGVVSRLWSNAAAAAFANPCLPAPAGPSFFSIPVHTQLQNVQLDTTLRQIEQLPVVAGQSTTLSVRLLSPSKPSPTWSVTPLEVPLPSATGSRPTLALRFAWQEAPGQASASGTDGDTLHLKITASASAPAGYTTVRLSSIGPTATNKKTEIDWVGVVLITK